MGTTKLDFVLHFIQGSLLYPVTDGLPGGLELRGEFWD